MLYGREDELGLIDKMLDGARDSQSAAMVLRGDPGIGKTALLDGARVRATHMQVLTVRGVESESQLRLAGLRQLPLAGTVPHRRNPRAPGSSLARRPRTCGTHY